MKMDSQIFRESVTDAIRYWEPWRLVYNGVLSLIVIIYFVVYLPESKAAISLEGVLFVFVLAVMANIAYCAAYVADVFAQASGFREGWRRYRLALWIIGVSFASVLTRWFAIALFSARNY